MKKIHVKMADVRILMVDSGANVTPASILTKIWLNVLVSNSHFHFRFSLPVFNFDCQDVRKHVCYTTIKSGMCLQTQLTSSAEPVSFDQCCCSGHGAGWGNGRRAKYNAVDCKHCPDPDSDEFKELCPAGKGYDKYGNVIDDFAVLPNACEVSLATSSRFIGGSFQ